MSSFTVVCKSTVVPGIAIAAPQNNEMVVPIDIHNTKNPNLPKLLTWILLVPGDAKVKSSRNRVIHRIPSECDEIHAEVCIATMRPDTPEEYDVLAVEITSPGMTGDNSPFPIIHVCGKFK